MTAYTQSMLCLHYVKNRGPIIVIPSLIVILYSLLLEKSNEKSFVVVAILKKKILTSPYPL